MKTQITVQRGSNKFHISANVNELGRGHFAMNHPTQGQVTAPCQLTKATMDMVNWSICKEVVCEARNLTDEHGRTVVENGKSVLELNIVQWS